MAYTPNQLAIINGTMAQFGSSECEFSTAFYNSPDTLATVLGANYITDGQKRGLTLDSIVWVATAAGMFQCYVTALQATSSGYGVTLAEMTSGTGTGVALVNTAITTVGAGTL